jgi:hypothetical protein
VRARQPTAAVDAGTVPPVIRALRSCVERFGMDLMPACTFPYLAHFPQLRELECSLSPKDLRALGLLPQLETLRLWLCDVEADNPDVSPPWSNGMVRTLGELPLQQLRSLRLEGNDEHPRMTGTSMQPEDPDFLCPSTKSSLWQTQQRRSRRDGLCFSFCVLRGSTGREKRIRVRI